MIDLARAYEARGQYAKAEPVFLEVKEAYLDKIENFFPASLN